MVQELQTVNQIVCLGSIQELKNFRKYYEDILRKIDIRRRKLTRKGWTNVSIRKTLHSDLISRAAYRKLSIGSYIQKLVDLDKKMEQFDALTTENIVNDMEKYLDMIVKLQEEDHG